MTKLSDYLPAPMPAEELREILGYNPETGQFWWKVNKGKKIKAGAKAGSLLKNGYVTIGISGRLYRAHRLAWHIVTGNWPPGQIDHKNLNKSDNRIENLRLATRAQNIFNRTSFGTPSGYRCVYRANKKWRAQVCINYKFTHLGVLTLQKKRIKLYALPFTMHEKNSPGLIKITLMALASEKNG